MGIPESFRHDAAALPRILRALLDAELAAGNEIVEVGHSFPAPPAGAYFKLARPVTTRLRAPGDGLDFRDFASSIYSGEFTDADATLLHHRGAAAAASGAGHGCDTHRALSRHGPSSGGEIGELPAGPSIRRLRNRRFVASSAAW